jgi:hypothetical protein
MKKSLRFPLVLSMWLTCAGFAASQTLNPNLPTWWQKYQNLSRNGASSGGAFTSSVSVSSNVDASNECGPQSETFITLNQSNPTSLSAGSNEIFRLPMRGYFSSDGGSSWGGVDLPLPPPLSGTNDTRFGSDPSLAFDTRGNVFYTYIVVFFGNGSGVNGSELAAASSSDGGQTYSNVTFFSFQSGGNHFNDKPMVTADTNLSSRFRDNVYVAWDAASGGSTGGGIRLARSTDHGLTFSTTRVDDLRGPGRGIGAVPFVGPNGEVYVAWNDFSKANTIAFNRSFDGGVTWGEPTVVAPKTVPFGILLPAESFRGALIYPACDADRSSGPHRGRLYCSWLDQTSAGFGDIFLSFSDDQGSTWSFPQTVPDPLPVDRFNQWLSVDPMTGDVNLSFYDTRNDTTGQRFQTDVYLTQSKDGGVTFLSPNVRVTTASSNEHDCNGVFPCSAIDYGNQYGDYEGLVSFNGVSHPVWTDSRHQLQPSSGCFTNLLMEEVFTATVKTGDDLNSRTGHLR